MTEEEVAVSTTAVEVAQGTATIAPAASATVTDSKMRIAARLLGIALIAATFLVASLVVHNNKVPPSSLASAAATAFDSLDEETYSLFFADPPPSTLSRTQSWIRSLQTSSSLSSSSSTFGTLTGALNLYEFTFSGTNTTHGTEFLFAPFDSAGNELDSHYFIYLAPEQIDQFLQILDNTGDLVVNITNAMIDELNGLVKRASTSVVTVIPATSSGRRRKRKLISSMGSTTAMGVIINLPGATPSYSQDEWYQILFQDSVSLKNQHAACSWGKFIVEPSWLGVITVTVDLPTSSNPQTVINAAQTAALQYISSAGQGTFTSIRDYADMVLFLTPNMGNWLAYASVGGGTSVYNDLWGGYVASNMHETGHNLGLLHSHQNGDQYMDYTGYMSGAIIGYHNKVGFPQECYDAVGLAETGWYSDRTIQVDLFTPTLVKLAAFTDYDKTVAGEHYCIIQSGNVYIHFNRATSFNADTAEYKDYMALYQAMTLGSYLFAALQYGQNPYYARTFPGTGTWQAQICGEYINQTSGPDYLLVSVGFGNSLCPGGSAGLVSEPTPPANGQMEPDLSMYTPAGSSIAGGRRDRELLFIDPPPPDHLHKKNREPLYQRLLQR